MKTVAIYNEKGNVASKTRGLIKADVAKHMFADYEKTPRGDFVKQVAVTERGEPIYAKVVLTIAIGEGVFAPKATKEKADAEVIEINLFD